MPKVLIFRLEGVLGDIQVDYTRVIDALRKEASLQAGVSMSNPLQILASLKKGMKDDIYGPLEDRVIKVLDAVELSQAGKSSALPGVRKGVERLGGNHDLAVVSELKDEAVVAFLRANSLELRVRLIMARLGAENKSLIERLKLGLERAKVSPNDCIYFCNRSAEVKDVKMIGLKVVVLPSKRESFNALLASNPDGMIISLEEVPDLLVLKDWKGGFAPRYQSDSSEIGD